MAAVSRSSRALQCFLRGGTSPRRSFIGETRSSVGAGYNSSVLIQSTTSAKTNPHRRFYSPSPALKKQAWDPALEEYKYWNREESKHGEASYVLDMSPESIQREARILCLADEDDVANSPLTDTSPEAKLPFGSRLLHVGTQPTDFPDSLVDESPNVLFVSPSWYVFMYRIQYLFVLSLVSSLIDFPYTQMECCFIYIFQSSC